MRHHRSRSWGFTLIEMLLVLFIGAILVFAAARSISSKQKPAVQSMLDELEGTLQGILKAQDLSPQSLQLVSAGKWLDRSLEIEAVDNNNNLVNPKFFAFGHPNWGAAGIDIDGTLMTTALSGRADLNAVPPCNVLPWTNAISPAGRLCNGGGSPTGNATSPLLPAAAGRSIQLNAYNRQFVTPFCIPVVGLNEGATYAGAPVGYVVVIGNQIYKYYSASPTDPWRRL